ncbi:MAG: hypothetical protein NVS3B25_35050 [Hymenobacter sp.]
MSPVPTIAELEPLFYQLSAAYGSPYADGPDTLLACCQQLRKALTEDQQTPEMLLEKVRQLRRKTGDYKSKFSVQVADKFWRKQLSQPITPTFYEPPQPVL